MAARQSLVMVHQARSAQSNELIPPPTALADLLDLLGQAGVQQRQHPLQPFSPTLFGTDGPPCSYDPAGLRGADLDSALNDFAWELEAQDDAHASATFRRHLVRQLGAQVIAQVTETP